MRANTIMQQPITFDEGRYKRRATWAVVAIMVFLVVYVTLLAGSIAATVGLANAAWGLMNLHPSFWTMALGMGMVLMGLFFVYVLVRFLFVGEKVDESHWIAVSAQEEPRLYSLIAEVASAAGAKVPSQVFFSSDVNASVSISPSFWGLVFPSKKRLQIGLGLMEALSVTEFKAVLAHEFGHFSQRSIRVGAYVYQVNRILHSILTRGEEDDRLVQKMQIVSWFLGFIGIAIRGLMRLVRWILIQVYHLVNLSHMALSREMEFHADMVAAQVAGSEALSRALLRLNLASFAESALHSFYNRKIHDAITTSNIFPQLAEVIKFFGEQNRMEFVGGLPIVPLSHLAKFNRSKLVINNQWESHPSTEDRIGALSQYPTALGHNIAAPSTTLLDKPEQWQSVATGNLFQSVKYEKPVTVLGKDEFVAEMMKEHDEASFDPIYNGYYDDKLPVRFDVAEAERHPQSASVDELFADEVVESLYQHIALNHDLDMLKQITHPESQLKTFDYDGKRYRRKHADELVKQLEHEMETAAATIKAHDVRIFQAALASANCLGKGEEVCARYEAFFQWQGWLEEKAKVSQALQESFGFLSQTLEFEVIYEHMKRLKEMEAPFRKQLKVIRNDPDYQSFLDDAMRKDIDTYLPQNLKYFEGNQYDNAALGLLLNVMGHYATLLNERNHRLKRELLIFQATFFKNAEPNFRKQSE